MGDHFFFGRPWHAVTGGQSEKGAFVSSEAGSGMTFHDPCNPFAKPQEPDHVSAALGMVYRMGSAPADIVEHRAMFDQGKIEIGVLCSILAGTVPDCRTMGNNFPAAAGIPQQILTCFLSISRRHGRAIS
jgi:hypothetical protein